MLWGTKEPYPWGAYLPAESSPYLITKEVVRRGAEGSERVGQDLPSPQAGDHLSEIPWVYYEGHILV